MKANSQLSYFAYTGARVQSYSR